MVIREGDDGMERDIWVLIGLVVSLENRELSEKNAVRPTRLP